MKINKISIALVLTFWMHASYSMFGHDSWTSFSIEALNLIAQKTTENYKAVIALAAVGCMCVAAIHKALHRHNVPSQLQKETSRALCIQEAVERNLDAPYTAITRSKSKPENTILGFLQALNKEHAAAK